MIERPSIRKDRASGRWIATRPRYGFAPGLEINTKLGSHRDAIDWVYRRGPGTPVTVLERSDTMSDGIAAVSPWTPLWYVP